MKSKSIVSLQTQISEQFHEEEGLQGEFSQSDKAMRLREQFNALESEERLFKEQAERVSTESAQEMKGNQKGEHLLNFSQQAKLA